MTRFEKLNNRTKKREVGPQICVMFQEKDKNNGMKRKKKSRFLSHEIELTRTLNFLTLTLMNKENIWFTLLVILEQNFHK